MKRIFFKSEKGMTLITLVVVIIVLMLLAAVSTYVVITGHEDNSVQVTNNLNNNEIK